MALAAANLTARVADLEARLSQQAEQLHSLRDTVDHGWIMSRTFSILAMVRGPELHLLALRAVRPSQQANAALLAVACVHSKQGAWQLQGWDAHSSEASCVLHAHCAALVH